MVQEVRPGGRSVRLAHVDVRVLDEGDTQTLRLFWDGGSLDLAVDSRGARLLRAALLPLLEPQDSSEGDSVRSRAHPEGDLGPGSRLRDSDFEAFSPPIGGAVAGGQHSSLLDATVRTDTRGPVAGESI